MIRLFRLFRLSAFAAVLAASLAAGAFAAAPAVEESAVEYREEDTILEGFLALPADRDPSEPLPAVVIVHQWKGLGEYEKRRARELAALGYAALAADIYGKGVRATSMAEAGKLAGQYKGDRPLLRRRVRAALDYLKTRKEADPARLAVMGYCFGGTAALEAARDGADIRGAVSFHGGLGTPMPAAKDSLKAKILVCHGADDPHVPPAEVAAFEGEMRAAGADWQLTSYGGAVHSFTDPGAGNDPAKGAAYNEAADRRSWAALKSFLAEVLAP